MKSYKSHRCLLLMGLFGNLLCWTGGVLLSLFQGSVAEFAVNPHWFDAPPWRFSLSAILGSVFMTFILGGFYGLYGMLKESDSRSALPVLVGGLLGCVPGAAFLLLCTTVAWFSARMGEAPGFEDILVEYFLAHSPIMAVCCLGLLVASLSLFRSVVLGRTVFPRWSSLFNILTVLLLGAMFKPVFSIPGTMNLGGVFMFGGLYCVSRRFPRHEYETNGGSDAGV